jgi:hypothetical protein
MEVDQGPNLGCSAKEKIGQGLKVDYLQLVPRSKVMEVYLHSLMLLNDVVLN